MKQKKSILVVVFSLILSFFFFILPVSHVAGQVSVPSIEKLFQDNVKELSDGELFYGCIINIEYGEEDLFTQKREIDFLHVGTAGQFAKLMFPSKHYEGDEGTPKIKDCYVFKTKVKILFSLTPAWGRAYIVKGDFKIEHPNKDAIKKPFKKKITLDEFKIKFHYQL